MADLADELAKLTIDTPKHLTSFLDIITEQKLKETNKNIWKDSSWKDIATLENNNVGIVGEQWVQKLCDSIGIEAVIDGATTKKKGGGVGDGTIRGRSVEIKCARQGVGKSATFQHELGEKPWLSDFMIFFDISPHFRYLTIFNNLSESEYKSRKKLSCFPTKSVTWRKQTGAFKFDTSVKINEQSIKKGHAMKIDNTTSNDTIGDFIRKIIAKTD